MSKKDEKKPVEQLTDAEILFHFRNMFKTNADECDAIFKESKSFRAVHAASRCAHTSMRAMRDSIRRGSNLVK